MNLTREEQETTINFDAASQTASVYTCHPGTIKKMEKLSNEFPKVYKRVKVDRWGGYWYEMPVRLLRFGKPASEARREASRKAGLRGQFKPSFTASTLDSGTSTHPDGEMVG